MALEALKKVKVAEEAAAELEIKVQNDIKTFKQMQQQTLREQKEKDQAALVTLQEKTKKADEEQLIKNKIQAEQELEQSLVKLQEQKTKNEAKAVAYILEEVNKRYGNC